MPFPIHVQWFLAQPGSLCKYTTGTSKITRKTNEQQQQKHQTILQTSEAHMSNLVIGYLKSTGKRIFALYSFSSIYKQCSDNFLNAYLSLCNAYFVFSLLCFRSPNSSLSVFLVIPFLRTSVGLWACGPVMLQSRPHAQKQFANTEYSGSVCICGGGSTILFCFLILLTYFILLVIFNLF